MFEDLNIKGLNLDAIDIDYPTFIKYSYQSLKGTLERPHVFRQKYDKETINEMII